MRKILSRLSFIAGCSLPLLLSCQTTPTSPDPGVDTIVGPPPSLAFLLDSLAADPTTISFHVDKSERQFTVHVPGHLLKSYPCVLGENPVGDKFHQGDRRTPEGTFGFRSKRVHNVWHKFIWVDYPNTESYRRYRARKAEGRIPTGKDIGGEIGIHGVPDGKDHWIVAGQDWTWGCIALRNADVDEIYPYISPGRTLLTIDP